MTFHGLFEKTSEIESCLFGSFDNIFDNFV